VALKPRPAGRTKAVPLGRPPGRFTQHRKLSRLLDLLERNPEGLTIPEMSTALRLTTRSVRRYLNYLKAHDSAAPLESIAHGPRGALRWRVNPRDRGRAMNLRRTQAYSLLATRRAFDALRGSSLYEEIEIVTRQILQLARRPLRALGGGDIASDTRLEDRFLYVPELSRVRTQKGGELDDLFRAVADLLVLSFRYASTARVPGGAIERTTKVTVHPYAMVLYRGGMHCIGKDLRTGEIQAYALERMRETEPCESVHFEIPSDFSVDDYVHGPFGLGPARHRVILEFEPRAGDDIRTQRVHPAQRLAAAADGRVRLSVTVPSLEEMTRWVLGFGSAARVIEPVELRDAVVRELKSGLLRYGR
jgi:predicted DNA-binding transcriptional regulator YafY